MKRFTLFLLVFFTVVLWPISVIGNGAPLRQVEAPIKPFAFYQNGEQRGVFYKLGGAIADEMNRELEFTIVPWTRIQHYMESGISDIEISPSYAELSNGRVFIEPAIGKMRFGLFTHKYFVPARGKFLVAVSKSSVDYYRKALGKSFEIATYEAFDEAILLLQTEKVDGIVMNALAFNFLIDTMGLARDDFAASWSVDLPMHITASAKSRNIDIKSLESAVWRLAQKGYLETLIEECIPRYKQGQKCQLETDY